MNDLPSLPPDPRSLDIARQRQIQKVKDQYEKMQLVASAIEKIGRDHKLTLAEMDEAWNWYVKRQNMITARRLIEKTSPPPLQLIENGRPI